MFSKYLIFTMAFVVLSTGCSQRSTVKDYIQPQKLSESYGDGDGMAKFNFELGVHASEVFDSPMHDLEKVGVGYIAGGMAKIFMNLAANLWMGKNKVTLYQPLPTLPTEYIKSAKINRVFFYIAPKDGHSRNPNLREKVFRGKGKVNFAFLKRLAIVFKPEHRPESDSLETEEEVTVESFSERELRRFNEMFDRNFFYDRVVDLENAEDLIMIKYEHRNAKEFIRNTDYGRIYMITTKEPAKVKHFLQAQPQTKDIIEKYNILSDSKPETNDTLMVELKKGPVANEMFATFLRLESEKIAEMDLEIEKCTDDICLDLKVPNLNLLPMLVKENSLRIDAYVDAGKLPEEFGLQGLLEFEVKVDSPI